MSKRGEMLEYWQNQKTIVEGQITAAESDHLPVPEFLTIRLKIIDEKIAALNDPDLLDLPD